VGISETNTATKISRIKETLKQNFSAAKKMTIMEDQELKEIWAAYDKKLEEARVLNLQSWALNLQCLRSCKAIRLKSKLTSLVNYKVGVIFWVLYTFYSWPCWYTAITGRISFRRFHRYDRSYYRHCHRGLHKTYRYHKRDKLQ